MLDAVLKLKSDFICEALDLAAVHSAWTFNYLEDCQHDRAIAAFRRFLTAVREAASEMKEIEAEMSARKLTGEAAVEWRRDRDRIRPKGKPFQPETVLEPEKSRRIGDSTNAQQVVADTATTIPGEAA